MQAIDIYCVITQHIYNIVQVNVGHILNFEFSRLTVGLNYLKMEVSGKRTDADGDVASVDKYCELCEADSVSTEASGYCKECEEYMCNACFRQHLRAKLCRDHTLLDTNASAEGMTRSNANAVQCKQHETETVKYYCRTHEAVGCGDCLVSKHGGCKPEFIKDLSDNFHQNEDYKTILKKIENQKHETNEFEEKIQESKKDNKLMLEKALLDIKQFRLDINKYLDKVETDITCQVKNVIEENDNLLAKLETDCTMLSAKLEEIADMLNSEQYKDTVLFIHTVECKSKASECEKAISDMKSKSMKKYKFIGDQQLQSLVNSAQKLGTLAISTTVVFPTTAEPANEKGLKSQVAVGARVKHNLPDWARMRGYGTVTAVDEDGTVTVKWSNGYSYKHRVGVGRQEVTLI